MSIIVYQHIHSFKKLTLVAGVTVFVLLLAAIACFDTVSLCSRTLVGCIVKCLTDVFLGVVQPNQCKWSISVHVGTTSDTPVPDIYIYI